MLGYTQNHADVARSAWSLLAIRALQQARPDQAPFGRSQKFKPDILKTHALRRTFASADLPGLVGFGMQACAIQHRQTNAA